jgi:hypothetical protein
MDDVAGREIQDTNDDLLNLVFPRENLGLLKAVLCSTVPTFSDC